MPVHRQKKLTTANTTDSSGEQPVPGLPEQQDFRQHLRELAIAGIRIVLDQVMREELDAALRCEVGREQFQAQRQAPRLLLTRVFSRALAALRTCACHEIAKASSTRRSRERDLRYEPQVAQGLDSDVCRWSEHPTSVGEVACKTSAGAGPQRLDLIVTDGHNGRLSAVRELFLTTPRQRCLLHKQRNVLPCCAQARASRGRDRTAGYLGSAGQAGRFDPTGCEHSSNMANSTQKRYEA